MNQQNLHELLPDLNVSRETEQLLGSFAKLVGKWTAKINLISTRSLEDIWERHILDSAQLYRFAPQHKGHWVDLGSGGGFPGIVISILARDRPEVLSVTLVECDQRKATFLRTAARELGLSIRILTTRIGETPPLHADILSARALGPLSVLLGYADRHLSSTGVAIFPKGRIAPSEIEIARQTWHFDLAVSPSMTNPAAQILRIENVAHV